VNLPFGGYISTAAIPCLSSSRLVRDKNPFVGITTTAGLANQGVVGSGSSNGNVGTTGSGGNPANTATNVSRNPHYNPNQNLSSGATPNSVLNARSGHHGGDRPPYRGHQGIAPSGNGQQGLYRPPPRQQHGGFHSQQYDNFGNDQGTISVGVFFTFVFLVKTYTPQLPTPAN